MAGEFPLPVRVVAGALAIGFERLRRLPQDLPGLSVTVAGQAMRASMRVQQEVAQLAGRGEELLGEMFTRPTEHPTWAHFDEDDEDAPAADAKPADTETADGTAADAEAANATASDGTAAGAWAASPAGAHDAASGAAGDRGHPTGRGRRGARPSPGKKAGKNTAAARTAATGIPGKTRTDHPAGDQPADRPAAGNPESRNPGSDPPDMPGYDSLRLPQVRARLRTLDAAAVARLLEHERAGAARAAFLTVLGNRLTTLQAGTGPDRTA